MALNRIVSPSASLSKETRLRRTGVGLYRILLRECRAVLKLPIFDNEEPTRRILPLQPPLDPRDYGNARLMRSNPFLETLSNPAPSDAMSDGIVEFLERSIARTDPPDVTSVDESLMVSPNDILVALRTSFRSSGVGDDPHEEANRRHRLAIDAVRILNRQTQMWRCGSTTVNRGAGVRVVATSRYVGDSSSSRSVEKVPFRQFTYRVRVENLNPVVPSEEGETDGAVQLLGRTWNITEEGSEEVVSVRQPKGGVVGKQPVIRPGEVFEYMSLCEIGTARGAMSGHLAMARVAHDAKSCMVGDPLHALDEGKELLLFDMPIDPFKLDAETIITDTRP